MDIQTLATYGKRLADDPKRLFRLLFSANARGILLNSWKEPAPDVFLHSLIDIPKTGYLKYLEEIKNDNKFHAILHKKHIEIRHKPFPEPQGWAQLIYILIRFLKPKTILETGVFDGSGSSFILNALNKNKKGKLISVDLPARHVIPGSTDLMPFTTLPETEKPGWLIPEYLRERWTLNIIKQSHELTHIIDSIGNVDIFLHDSLHTKAHMAWEMQTAWPHLKKGGILLVDDIFYNSAYKDFCKRLGRKPIFKYGLGAIKK